MKNVLILVCLISFASELKAQTKVFYLKFKGQTDSEALDKVDQAIPGILTGKYKYRHQRLRVLYASKGCDFTRPKNISLKAVTVKKAYRVNRHGELETFQQATVKVAHNRCHGRDND